MIMFISRLSVVVFAAIFAFGFGMRCGWCNDDASADVKEIERLAEAELHEDEASQRAEVEKKDEPPPAIRAPKPKPSIMNNPEERAVLIEALQRKEMELIEAKKEVVRLQDLIRRIWKANRREKRDVHYNMGCVYKAAGNYRKAEEEFRKALSKDPGDASVHYNLAILYDDDLKDAKKARWHYERFLELTPSERDAAQVMEWLATLP